MSHERANILLEEQTILLLEELLRIAEMQTLLLREILARLPSQIYRPLTSLTVT